MPSDLRDDNFRAIQQRFCTKTAIAGEQILRSGDDLSVLLRSHLLRAVGDRESRRREAVDDLLAFYSVIEVATLAGYVGPRYPTAFEKSARACLGEPSARRYYEKLYPLLLPRMLHARLAGRPVAAATSETASSFVTFLTLSDDLEADDVETFLWFLDDGTVGGLGLSDLLGLLQKGPDHAMRVLSGPAADRPDVLALRGFARFLSFCRGFDALLQAETNRPVVQSAYWHFHGYWFLQLSGQVQGVLSAIVEQYRDWVLKNGERRKLAQETRRSMDTVQDELQRLTSSIYRVALERLVLGGDTSVRRSTRPRGRNPHDPHS